MKALEGKKGSGSVDKQCNSSEVSSGDITGSSPQLLQIKRL